MRSERGVRTATWLMRHVGPPSEALAGDLLEEYRQGRSVGWYWMQVIEAVVAGVYRQRLRRYALNVGKVISAVLLSILIFYGLVATEEIAGLATGPVVYAPGLP